MRCMFFQSQDPFCETRIVGNAQENTNKYLCHRELTENNVVRVCVCACVHIHACLCVCACVAGTFIKIAYLLMLQFVRMDGAQLAGIFFCKQHCASSVNTCWNGNDAKSDRQAFFHIAPLCTQPAPLFNPLYVTGGSSGDDSCWNPTANIVT